MSKVLPLRKIKFQVLCRREKWVLTVRGWMLLLTLLGLLGAGIFTHIHDFLAVNQPLQADALVVEGWIDDANVKMAIDEFKSHNYKFLITTGGPLPKGFYLAQYKNYAEISSATLRKFGFNPAQLVTVPAQFAARDRTYNAALALKQWFLQTTPPIQTINVYTRGVHARRSWLLYRKALEDQRLNLKIGIVASPDLDYDPQTWWKSSAGVKHVMNESISYWYTHLFNVLES